MNRKPSCSPPRRPGICSACGDYRYDWYELDHGCPRCGDRRPLLPEPTHDWLAEVISFPAPAMGGKAPAMLREPSANGKPPTPEPRIRFEGVTMTLSEAEAVIEQLLGLLAEAKGKQP